MIAGLCHHVRQWKGTQKFWSPHVWSGSIFKQNLSVRIGLRKGGGRKLKKKMNGRTKWPAFKTQSSLWTDLQLSDTVPKIGSGGKRKTTSDPSCSDDHICTLKWRPASIGIRSLLLGRPKQTVFPTNNIFVRQRGFSCYFQCLISQAGKTCFLRQAFFLAAKDSKVFPTFVSDKAKFPLCTADHRSKLEHASLATRAKQCAPGL